MYKEITYMNVNFKEFEEKYFENFSTWRVEEFILETFSKTDLKKLIFCTKEKYMELMIPYKHLIYRKIYKMGGKRLSKIERYFIEKYEFYFNGGCEIEKIKEFLNRLEKFYKLNFKEKNKFKNYKIFDINSISIIDVLSNYIKIPNNIKKNISCPLHKEKSGSFRIYKNTNSFYCFGCKKGGGIVEFVSEIEKITKKEAYKKLANLFINY